MNKKGFTLVELLAVIAVMGILLGVAIPAISKTVDNARKDTFVDTAKKYGEGLKSLWVSDRLDCFNIAGKPSSFDGYSQNRSGASYFYVPISSEDAGTTAKFGGKYDVKIPKLLESGGKSAWGGKDVTGYGVVEIIGRGSSLKVNYYVSLVDGTYGIVDAVNYTKIVKNDIELEGASKINYASHTNPIKINIVKSDSDSKETVTAYLCQGL